MMAQLVFRGWEQLHDEVITVTATERGLLIDVTYDGGKPLDVKPAISWTELDALRKGALQGEPAATPERV